MTSSNLYSGKLGTSTFVPSIDVQVVLYSDRLVVHYRKQDGRDQTETWSFLRLSGWEKLDEETVRIKSGETSEQILEVKSIEFVQKFNPPRNSSSVLLYKLKYSGIAIFLTIGTVIVALLAALYFFALPWVGELSVSLIPKKYEIQMGEALYKNIISHEKIDTSRTSLANRLLKQIDFETDYPLQVTIVKSSVKNAFALPGGHLVVYSHLLDDMQSYEEFVALLGHEAGHVKHRHTTKHILRSLSGYMLISLLFGDASGFLAVVVENANQLHQLSYSRSLETEADEAGYKTLVHNKVNPAGILHLFENLQKGSVKTPEVTEFLSTHPITDHRKKFIQDKMLEDRPSYTTHPTWEDMFRKMKK